MCPVLPHGVQASALQAQIQLEKSQDTAAMATFNDKVRAWNKTCSPPDSIPRDHEASAHVTLKGEDGVERPCCAFVRPLQLGRSVHAA